MSIISLKKVIKRNPGIILYLLLFILSGCATIPIKQWEYKTTGTIPPGSFNISELKPLKIAVMYPKDQREQKGKPGRTDRSQDRWQRNDEYLALAYMEKKKPLIYPDLLLIGRSIVDELRAMNLFQRVDWAPKIDKDYDFKIFCSLNSLEYDGRAKRWGTIACIFGINALSFGIGFQFEKETVYYPDVLYRMIYERDLPLYYYTHPYSAAGIGLIAASIPLILAPVFLKKKIDGVLTAYIEDPSGNRSSLKTIRVNKKAVSGDLYYEYALSSFAPQIAPLVIQDIQNMMGSQSGVQFVRARAQHYYQVQDAELIAFEKELQRRMENKLINDPMTRNLARAYVLKTSLLESLRQLEDKYMEEEQKLQDQEFKKFVDTTYNAWKVYTAQKNKEMLMTVLSIGAAFTSAAFSAYVNIEAQQAAGLGQYNIADSLSMTASTITSLGYEAFQRGSAAAEVASILRGEIAQKVEADLGESLKKFRKIRGTIKEVHDQWMDAYLEETPSFDDVMASRWPKK